LNGQLVWPFSFLGAFMNKYSDLLFKAADLLDERGWTVGAYQNKKGQLCLLGALCEARNFVPTPWGALDELLMFLERDLLEPSSCFSTLIAFNDRDLTSKEEAVDFLIAAAYF
jgi:hypothetical protein